VQPPLQRALQPPQVAVQWLQWPQVAAVQALHSAQLSAQVKKLQPPKPQPTLRPRQTVSPLQPSHGKRGSGVAPHQPGRTETIRSRILNVVKTPMSFPLGILLFKRDRFETKNYLLGHVLLFTITDALDRATLEKPLSGGKGDRTKNVRKALPKYIQKTCASRLKNYL
jgi:hypothetical protein